MKRLLVDFLLLACGISLVVLLNVLFSSDEALREFGPGYGAKATNRIYVARGFIFVLGSIWLASIPWLRNHSSVAEYLGRFCRGGDYRVFYAMGALLFLLGIGSVWMGAMGLGVPNP